MTKRKLDTGEQKLTAPDQSRKAKKHKRNHEVLPVVDDSVADRAVTSLVDECIESAKAGGGDTALSREILERLQELKRTVMEELQSENGTLKNDGQMAEKDNLQDSAPIRQKKKRRKHKQKEASRGQDENGEDEDKARRHMVGEKGSRSTEGQEERKHKHKDKDRQRQKRRLREDDLKDNSGKTRDRSAWGVSEPIAGHLGDLDPVFSHDEQYLLLAYHTSIAVYSTSTSLLIRQLQVKKDEHISGFSFAPQNQNHLYISTVSGLIEKWDWVEGSRLGQWKLSSSIQSLLTSTSGPNDSDKDLVYTVDRKEGEPWLLSAHRLVGVADAANADVVTLLKYEEALSSFQVLEGGKIIVAASGSHIILGHCEAPDVPTLQDLIYVWRVIESPEWVASIDARYRPRLEQVADKKAANCEGVDIAIAGYKGSIYIYEDLLARLIRKERFPSEATAGDITSRRLHWHRNSVLAVKWSLDGNYIISGGLENTLVLWQLETGQKQFLPHLGSPVESIVVSPTGSSYSLRLADNSAMILSTSELKPTFSTTGIQIPSKFTSPKSTRVDLPASPNVSVSEGTTTVHIPACVSSGHLLLAVPPSVSSRQIVHTARNPSYLQTFDIGGCSQLSRQALTRTKVTTLNMGPESNIIEEPSVTHIQLSHDGQWLATVDVWMPPKSDLARFAFGQEQVIEEQAFRQETYLKFWSWNADSKVWELVSRIDNPHASQNGNPYEQGRVLELVSNPNAVGFATVGQDGIVKSWRPAIRRRHGLEVRGKDGSNLRSWYCKHAIHLELTLPEDIRGAKLCYSQDGSVLAVGLQTVSQSPIYLLDTHSGTIRSVQTELYSGPLLGLSIINKYLITLSDDLCVWDLVIDERVCGIQLRSHILPLDRRANTTHLAVDAPNGIFAIAVPDMRDDPTPLKEPRSQIAIFDPANASPLFTTSLRSPVTHLLPATRRKAFYIINPAAEIRTIALKQPAASLAASLPKLDEEAPASRGLSDIFGNWKRAEDAERDEAQATGLLTSNTFDNNNTVTQEPHPRIMPKDDEADVVVSQERLAEVFDVAPAYALPPVTELFEQVASLYSGRLR